HRLSSSNFRTKLMKKLILLSIGILGISFRIFGQEVVNEKPVHPWSFGISTADILRSISNTENENKPYAAFVVDYAWSKNALQLGFRPDYNHQDTQHEGFVDTEVTKTKA